MVQILTKRTMILKLVNCQIFTKQIVTKQIVTKQLIYERLFRKRNSQPIQNQGLNIPIKRAPHLKTVLLYQKLTQTFTVKNLSTINT